MTSPVGPRIEAPEALVSWHRKIFGETGRALIDALPDLGGVPRAIRRRFDLMTEIL